MIKRYKKCMSKELRIIMPLVALACLHLQAFGMFRCCRPERSSVRSQTPPHITTVNVTQRDRQGNTALHTISNTRRAQRLMALGADPNARNHHNQTPLHTAASARIARVLIQAGTNVNAVDIYKQTALHIASEKGDGQMIHALLNAKAKLDACDFAKITPLHIALFLGKRDVINQLLHAGADTESQRCGLTALQASFPYIQVIPDVIRQFLEFGAHIHDANPFQFNW